jgi:hypothetical protein
MSTADVLKAYVPPFVREDPVMGAYFDAVGPELEAMMDQGVSIPEQAWPHLVTWGIARLERIYGVQTDESAAIEKRRSALIAKMRGAGTSTVQHIEGIAASYANGAVLLTEDIPNYTVTIEFTDELGVPPYLDELKAALRAAIPAHLLIEYILLWTTWGDLNTAGITWGALNTLGVTWGELKTYEIGG